MKLSIIENYKSNYCVVIPQDASLIEKTASEELCEYIKKAFVT